MKTPLLTTLRNRSADWQIGVAVIVLVAIARFFGIFEAVEWNIFDNFLRMRPQEDGDAQIVLVGIDAADLKAIGSYPVPDRILAELIEQIYQYDPAVVGLNIFRDIPVGEGREELVQLFQQNSNLIITEKLIPPSILPPEDVPEKQVGFNDYFIDADGLVRRAFLGLSLTGRPGDFRYSFSLLLAQHYLEQQHGIMLENGIKNPQRMRFGTVEIPHIPTYKIRGYDPSESGGLQVFLNYRNNASPFALISFSDLFNNSIEPNQLKDKVVIIGNNDPGAPQLINTPVRSGIIPQGRGTRINSIFGLEYQAHAVSQIINAVREQRPFITTWGSGWDYLWLSFWGIVGILLGYLTGSSWKNFTGVIITMMLLVAIAFISLAYFGWWIPIVPSLAVLVVNGATYATLYQRERALRERIDERQQTIEQTFNLIHNGPLQTLAGILRTLQETELARDTLIYKLEGLNQEIRGVGEYLHSEYLTDEESFYLGNGSRLDLKYPVHELFYEVYDETLKRDLKGFQSIKIRIRDFEPIEKPTLSVGTKRELCRFLEEALCNVGKHAINATRLTVIGAWQNNWYSLSVTDNGVGHFHPHRKGKGTQHCITLARELNGKFIREPMPQRGMKCELTWPAL